jgi:hypothetical protein
MELSKAKKILLKSGTANALSERNTIKRLVGSKGATILFVRTEIMCFLAIHICSIKDEIQWCVVMELR